MENIEFEQQRRAYNNYVNFFTPELLWTNTIYKDLYNGLTDSLEVAKASLGDYYFEKYVNDINENFNRIENGVNTYIKNNNYDKLQKENLFYHKPLLENRINELLKEFEEFIKISKRSNTKTTKDKNYSFDCTLNKHQIEYLYTNYFSIYFDCNKEDIINLFSDNITANSSDIDHPIPI